MCDVLVGCIQLLRNVGADCILVLRQDLTELVFDQVRTCQTLRREDVESMVEGCWVCIFGVDDACCGTQGVQYLRCKKVSRPLHGVVYAVTLTAETAPLSLAKVKISVSIDAVVAFASHDTRAIQGVAAVELG